MTEFRQPGAKLHLQLYRDIYHPSFKRLGGAKIHQWPCGGIIQAFGSGPAGGYSTQKIAVTSLRDRADNLVMELRVGMVVFLFLQRSKF
jgi:hypothetical protein